MVGYVIDEYTIQINGGDKRVQSKKIINFRETNEPAIQTASADSNPRSGANFASGDAFGQRLAIHGMVNGLLAAGDDPKQVMATLPDLLNLEDAIDEVLAVKTDYLPPDELPDL